MQNSSTVTVLGAGYVGLTTAVLFANAGIKTELIEINPERLKTIQSGKSFFYEEGLNPILKPIVDSKMLTATSSFNSLKHADVVFSCVGTPDKADGSTNMEYVMDVAHKAADLMKDNAVFVQKSTVLVGTGDAIQHIFAEAKKKINYVSNPEFLREGTALLDTLWFDRVVIGGDNKAACETVIDLYKQVEEKREDIARAADIIPPRNANYDGEYIVTSQNSAELIKVTSNAFLALKISFANSIAKLADASNADITEVMDAVGADKRIGRAFLNSSRGYGGGCFPKDVSGMIMSAASKGVDMHILESATSVNNSMPAYILRKLQTETAGTLAGKKIAVLGLSFKAGTSDARRSSAVYLANLFAANGMITTAYDPEANEEARDSLDAKIKLHHSIEACVKDAAIVCIATDWRDFTSYDLRELRKQMMGNVFVDAMNAFDVSNVESAGFHHIGVGRGSSNQPLVESPDIIL